VYSPTYSPTLDIEAGVACDGTGMLTSHNRDTGSGAVQHECETEWRATVQIRDIPCNYSKEQMMKLIDSKGFAGSYDYFYLPVDFKKGSNPGYAYVNFVSVAKAKECFAEFDGFWEWPEGGSKKTCKVCWGRVQGYEKNVRKWTNSQWDEKYKPTIFNKGGL
jgi:hypothetical protein